MELSRIIDTRYSVRRYDLRPVEREKLDAVLTAGMKAPTGKNFQPQRIYVIQSHEAMRTLKSVCKCTFDAPAALLVCVNKDEAWHNRLQPGYDCGEMDVSIVTTFMMLKAVELGLGTCWVRYFNADEVAKAFALPENIVPACVLDIGYPAMDSVPLETMHNKPRPIDEVVTVL